MEATIIEISNTFNTGYKNKITNTYTVKGKDKDELFRNAYPYERQLRYCNGCFIKFEDEELNKEYSEWLKTNLSIELYYGGGVVD